MPEALAVVAVVVVSLAAWLGAWLHARNVANYVVRDEVVRLRHQVAWLRERLERAEREGWDEGMRCGLEAEWRAARAQLRELERGLEGG